MSDEKAIVPTSILKPAPARKLTYDEIREMEQQAGYIQRAALAETQVLQARQRLAQARLATVQVEAQIRAVQEGSRGERSRGSGLEDDTGLALTDRQIESLALKAVVRFARLPDEEAIRAWRIWQEELRRRFPAFAAAEIIQRARELRELAG